VTSPVFISINSGSHEKPLKKCSKCGEIKPFTEYHKASERKIGIKSACKVCCNYAKAKACVKYKEKYKERSKKWGNPETTKKREQRKIKELTRSYINKLLRAQYEITTNEINKIPQLIELKKVELKNKRLCQKN